jgi:hypothetical protein
MKVAFCIPTTSANRDWESIEDSFLFQFKEINTKHEVDYFIGYDQGDSIFSKKENQAKLPAQWIECNFEKGYVTAIWNKLFEEAIALNTYDYFWIAGDDISYNNEDWLDELIHELAKTDGKGIAGVYNGNPNLPMTQFLLTKSHFDLFGFMYPYQIKNWYCDDWITEVYPQELVHYRSDIECLNSGGEPRYKPDNLNTEWKDLVIYYRNMLMEKHNLQYKDQSIGYRFNVTQPHYATSKNGWISRIVKSIKSLLN